MAGKKNKQPNTGTIQSAARPQPQKQAPEKKAAQAGGQNLYGMSQRMQLLIAAGIAIITWLFLKTCLNNQFTNWDDPGYIKDDTLIKSLSGDGIKNIFSTAVMGNYHPLTIFSYAVEYSFVRLEPYLYHADSLLLHILTTLLAYWFVTLLTRKPIAGMITALLFGLHPMHMESVAWLAARKDVLYGAFYLASCIAYVYYLRDKGSKRTLLYAGVLLLFVCSLLSKPVAVTLPLALLLIDYFEGRYTFDTAGQYVRAFKEKIPHFAIAIAFGIKSVIDQRDFGALGTQNIHYNFIEHIALGGYALITYLWKAIVPANLSCFYPYPEKAQGGMLHFGYFLYPVAAALIVAAIWWLGRKNKSVVFGTLFFLVNIILLLQFIPVGGAILADRYSYIPYLGLFFIAGWFVAKYLEDARSKQPGYTILGISLAYILVLGYLSGERCKDWYDTTTLWRDEIGKQPDAPNAYNNLGFNYFNMFNESVNTEDRKRYYDSAYMLLNKAISLQKDFVNPYVSLGELQRGAGKFPEAKGYYYKAISLHDKEGSANAYLGLAIVYAISQNLDSSGICFRTAISIIPVFPEAHSNYGNYFDMLHQSDSALAQYNLAIAENPDMYAFYLNRGRLLQRMHRCDEGMQDFESALSLNPTMGEIYYARSYCFTQKGNKVQALQDVDKAISLGFRNIDNAYYQMLKGR